MIVFWILAAWIVACVIFTLGYVFGALMEATRPRGHAIDLSGAAARGESSFMDRVGRSSADDPRGGRTW
jgi:hypothetical protein